MAHNLEFYLKVAEKIQITLPEYHFVFIGAGANKKKLLSIVKGLSLQNVNFYDNAPKGEIPSILYQINFALVHLRPDPTFTSVIPSKIFEIAAMQIPILNGVQGEAKSIIENNEIGICYDPNSIDDFINVLINLSNNTSLISKIKKAQIIFAQSNSRKKRADEMLVHITNIR
jgi:hypothetical protein